MSHVKIDQETINQFCNGEEAAFNKVYSRLGVNILRYGRHKFRDKDVVNDYVQDVFVRAWNNREKFRGKDSFENYFFILAKNVALKRIKRSATENLAIENYFLRNKSRHSPSADQDVQEKELAHLISTAISTSPERRQRIFRMSRENGLSHDDIAQEMGLARQTVSNEVQMIMDHIRGYIKSYLVAILLLLLNY